MSAEQGGFPVSFRDADIYIELNDDLPEAVQDWCCVDSEGPNRRLGFDPTAEWTLNVQAQREHGMFQAQNWFRELSRAIRR